jgi:mono/diheme cytochrome c family protein
MRKLVGVAALLLIGACQQQAPAPNPSQAPAQTSASAQSPIERGRYLVEITGCHDCHTPKKPGTIPPEPDMARELSGNPSGDVTPVPASLIGPGKWMAVTNEHLGAWAGPWGVSFAINLTPDKETGLGSWNEQMFMDAIRSGKHQGTGRPILPPMPWPDIKQMTDDDLKAVWAYLQSRPPVKNVVPQPLPPDKILK